MEGFRLFAGPFSVLEEETQLNRAGQNYIFYINLRHELASAIGYNGSSKKFTDYARIAKVWLEGTFDGLVKKPNVSDRLIVPVLKCFWIMWHSAGRRSRSSIGEKR